MAMQLVKKTTDYSIFKRGDNRYAVKGANGQAINGDEKVRILTDESLLKVAEPAAPKAAEAPAASEEPPAAGEEASAAEAADATEQAPSEESEVSKDAE